MPRSLIERTFPDGLALTADHQGAQVCLTVVGNNSTEGCPTKQPPGGSYPRSERVRSIFPHVSTKHIHKTFLTTIY